MADDDRTRRRLSDATKSRIADLASGWSVDSAPSEPAAAPDDADPPRKKQRTIPPPAPGSPERHAFEQTVVAASGADREDATDVLPPKRPTGAQPSVARGSDRDDATNEVPPKRPTGAQAIVARGPEHDDRTDEVPKTPLSGAHSIVATTRPREDVTEELLDIDPSVNVDAARPSSSSSGQRPADPWSTQRGLPASSQRPADARSTQPSSPPPPPSAPPSPSGRARRFSQQPVFGDRPTSVTGPQAIIGARTKGATGQVPIVGDEPPVGGRARSMTGPQSIIPDIPMRPRMQTGELPAVSRPRAATGQHAIIPTRSQTPSAQPPVGGARTRGPSASPPSGGGSRSPFNPVAPPPGRSRRMTDEQPDVASRAHMGTGPSPIVPSRTRESTGSQPIVSNPSKGALDGRPLVSGRTQGGTGPQPIVPARNKESTGEQPIVRRSQPLTGPHGAGASASSGPHSVGSASSGPHGVGSASSGPHSLGSASSGAHGVVKATMEPSGTAPHSGVPSSSSSSSGRASPSVPPPTPLATARTKTSTRPPPPPGSPERLAADRSKPASAPPPSEKISAFSTQPFGSADRKKAPSAPPTPLFESYPKPADAFDDETNPGPPPAMATDRNIASPTAPAVRGTPASAAPPATPVERSKAASAPPPTAIAVPPLVMSTSAVTSVPAAESARSGPQYPRASNDAPAAPFATENRTFSTEPRTPAVIVDVSLEEARSAPVKQTVPTGEFDSGVQTLKDKTNPRDVAEALLSIPQAETPVEDLLEDDEEEDEGDPEPVDLDDEDDEDEEARHRPLHAAPDPETEKFQRGDPTQDAPPDSPEVARMRPKHPTGGTLRASAALRRKRGRWGDVRYVSTAVFGVRRARRELVELEHRQGLRQTSRRRHLITLGRTAAVMDNFDHPALGKAREQLSSIEDERSKHAGAVAASDAELERVRRDRDNNAKQYAISVSEADAELVELAAKLEPVEKEAVAVRKRASDLREELHRIEKQIADAEASLVSTKIEKLDKAAVQADIATYKANKVAVLRDEPVIATELDALDPRIAAMEATRAGLEKKKADLEKAEQEDQRRTLELLEAIGAKRKVVERAAADAETARDTALFELGERLYVDRSPILTAQLSPIDQIDLEIGEGERRTMELKEILSNIDKAKFARGLAIMILAAGALASLAYLIASAVL